MRFSAGVFALLLTAFWLLPAQSSLKRSAADPKPDPPPAKIPNAAAPGAEKLTYDVEWHSIHAGAALVETQNARTELKLDTAGVVSTLFKVHDVYSVNYDDSFCATSSVMDSFEGKRHHETKVAYDRARNHATLLERDLIKNAVVRTSEIDVPSCVQEVVSGLLQLRRMSMEPGQSTHLPMSDGRRAAPVKIEAQEREPIKTPAGAFRTIRYEAFMLNGVLYTRKGRLFVWLSDDARHLPVQIRLRMQFPIGTVTLQLQKEEGS